MTLAVYIIENGQRSPAYLERLKKRLQFVKQNDFIYCKNLSDVNERLKFTSWYLVLYEGELPDSRLTLAILKIVQSGGFGSSVFNFFSRNDRKYLICGRLFKSFVKLQKDVLMTDTPIVTVATTLVDGWIWET